MRISHLTPLFVLDSQAFVCQAQSFQRRFRYRLFSNQFLELLTGKAFDAVHTIVAFPSSFKSEISTFFLAIVL